MPQSRASAETTTQSAPTVHGLERLAHADIFSGRRDEQRTLRSYLAERKGLVYVWGIAGIGKSALVRHVLERPGTELSIDGVLVIPGSTPPQALYSTFARFVAEQFPAAVPHLKRLMTAPRESITALNSIVQGKQLVVVIDGLDAHMQPGTHYHWEFTNPQLRELFTALTAAKWSLTVVVTSRFRWEYLLTMPLEHQAEIVLHGLQPQECAFIFQSFDSVVKANKIDRIDVPQLFNLISGHPRTLSDMLRQLEANPQRFASTDMETMLANYWKSSFVDDVLRYLKPTEREALDVMSIHRAPFKPEHAQNLIGASALGDTEAIVTVWEALSLAQFLDTDEEDTPWYIIPKYISVPISSTISEQRKPLLHRKVAQSIELSFYRTLYDEDDAQQPLLSVVLERLGELFDQAHPQLVDHYVNLAYQWQEHYRKAGDTVQADQIALALLPPLSMFGRNEQMTELSNAILQSATKDESSILWAKYWQAVVALREKQYDTAFKMFSELSEKSKGRTELQLLYARSLERQGTILRAQTKRKDAILRWKEAARACVQNKDMTGLGRALSYLIQTHFHAGEYPESVEYIKQGFTAYKSWRMTSEDYMILGEMMIYRAHIYRHTGNDVEALKHYNEAYHIGKENGAGFLIGQALEHTAHVYMLLRQYELAAQILLSAVDVYERMESNADLSMALTKLAVVQDFRGNPKDALGHAERAFRLAQEHLPTNVDQTTKLIQNLKRKAR
jgi:tetratricopeptide (TPR) repeat protein